jgi:CelD/BcsL family acetyltransferase involved in cellulose biosynthesis
VLDLTKGNADLAGIAPPRLLYNLRNAWRRAAARGDARIARAEMSSCSAALECLFELHSARWATQGEVGILSQPALQAFHRDVAIRFLRRGWLRLYTMQIGSNIVAANYGFHLRGRSYSYVGGFDSHFSKLSPGAMIIRHAISDAVRDGARVFDFLRGGEPYKYRWGARDERQFRLRIVAPARASRAMQHLDVC